MKSNRTKICILSLIISLLFMLSALPMAFGEETEAPAAETVVEETVIADEAADEAVVEETAPVAEEDDKYALDIAGTIKGIAKDTGFTSGDWRQYVMIGIACVLLYLAIVKKFEPLLLLPIGFGMLLANLPGAGLMEHESYQYFATMEEAVAYAKEMSKDLSSIVYGYAEELGAMAYRVPSANAGLLYYLYQGVKLGIYPPLIFMGVGAMTDFAPLIANPKSLLLGAAAQLGIFLAFTFAICFGFDTTEAASIGIIGGADGPTAIYLTTKLAPHMLGAIAVAAYSYMALVPVIQPPIMRALTTKKERNIVMKQLRPVTKTQLIIFPVMVTLIVSLLLPSAAPLVGMLMLGNLLRVSGVTERLSKTATNELCNIVTIFLGVTVGATTNGATFLTVKTLGVFAIGIFAFAGGTSGGVLLAKLMNKLAGGNSINPLIGSAGVSAVPMAARVSQDVGQKENPGNFLLMHAMGPNVAGVIGSAVAAGVFLSMFG